MDDKLRSCGAPRVGVQSLTHSVQERGWLNEIVRLLGDVVETKGRIPENGATVVRAGPGPLFGRPDLWECDWKIALV